MFVDAFAVAVQRVEPSLEGALSGWSARAFRITTGGWEADKHTRPSICKARTKNRTLPLFIGWCGLHAAVSELNG